MVKFVFDALILVAIAFISYRLIKAGLNDLKKARQIKRGLKK